MGGETSKVSSSRCHLKVSVVALERIRLIYQSARLTSSGAICPCRAGSVLDSFQNLRDGVNDGRAAAFVSELDRLLPPVATPY